MKANDSVVSFFARSSKHSPCEAGYKELKRLLQVLALCRACTHSFIEGEGIETSFCRDKNCRE